MQPAKPTQLKDIEALTDSDLVGLAKEGNAAAFRAIMQRHNRRLYRVARGILRDESEAEDAVQEAYVRAFTHLAEFRGQAKSASEKGHGSRRMRVAAAAIVIRASEVSTRCSKSRTRRRFLMSHANERSMTQRRGSGSKPIRVRGRLTMASATWAFARAQASRRPA